MTLGFAPQDEDDDQEAILRFFTLRSEAIKVPKFDGWTAAKSMERFLNNGQLVYLMVRFSMMMPHICAIP